MGWTLQRLGRPLDSPWPASDIVALRSSRYRTGAVNGMAQAMTEHAALVSWIVVIKAVVFVFLLGLVGAILPSLSMPKPPLSVRVVGDLEFAFGVCLALPPIIVVMLWPATVLGWKRMLIWGILLALGLTWDIMAIQLLSGVPWAKRVCLLLASVRIVALVTLPFSLDDVFLYGIRGIAMVGIPISLVTLYVLCRSGSAQSFFRDRTTARTRAHRAKEQNDSR